MRSHLFLATILAVVLRDGDAYGMNFPRKVGVSHISTTPVSRENFLATIAGALTIGMVSADVAWAKDSDSTKGTKEDPIYQACLSQCELQVFSVWFMMMGP
jgi:hypothetical protein